MDNKITQIAREVTPLESSLQLCSQNTGFLECDKISRDGLWQRTSAKAEWRLSVPESLKESVLESYHDWIGPGVNETYRTIQSRFFWNNMLQDVRENVQLCRLCACT